MKNKLVLITGSTSGIGKQTALGLAKLGAQVILTGRNRDSAQAAVDEISQASGNSQVEYMLADLSGQAGVRSLAEQLLRQWATPRPKQRASDLSARGSAVGPSL